LAASRQNPAAPVTIPAAAGAGGLWPIRISHVPPPGPVSTRGTLVGSRLGLSGPRHAGAGRARGLGHQAQRRCVGYRAGQGGCPRMSFWCIHSSNARTTSSMPGGSRMPGAAISARK
jgi:hypothetical protein